MRPTVHRCFWWSWDDSYPSRPNQYHVHSGLPYSYPGMGVKNYMSFRLSEKV